MSDARTPWLRFWDGDHSIYASERHRIVHYRRIADDLIAAIPSRDATVLDFGCGEALDAERIARACARLVLCEASSGIHARLVERFRDSRQIVVVRPDELGRLDPGSVDLAVLNSVVQYLTRAELDDVLQRIRRVLRPRGRLLVGDVVPPGVPTSADVASLLRTAAHGGFLPAALLSLVRTFFSDYRRLRRDVGLATYDEAAMAGVLAANGFSAHRRAANIGFHARRMTFLATPTD